MAPCHLEIACFNVESAQVAAKSGASRIELCANLDVGGTTPEVEAHGLRNLKKELGIPVFVMIRPRGGDFDYNSTEFELMRQDIVRLREAADGFVFGVLDKESRIDKGRNQLLVSDAQGRPCTMHKAFDETPDLLEALERVIECGFSTVLTSGAAMTAAAGVANLTQLIEMAGERITIMPGGGIRRNNILEIKKSTGAGWLHSAALVEGNVVGAEEVEALRQALQRS